MARSRSEDSLQPGLKVGTVTWMLNGKLQGELGGVSRSTGGLGATGLLSLAGLLLMRRRERRPRA